MQGSGGSYYYFIMYHLLLYTLMKSEAPHVFPYKVKFDDLLLGCIYYVCTESHKIV